MQLNLIFMGTPAFALPALEALHDSAHNVVAVYTQPPRPAGRGQKEQPSPVQQFAEAHGIPVFTPTSLKSAEEQAQFAEHNADVAVVAAYGLLLPKVILDAPRFGCINIHPSALPRWRGAAPIQRTLMAGDQQTALCIMQMDEGLDTGDVLLSEPFYIPPRMDAGELHDALATRGAQLTLDALKALAAGTATRTPQMAQGVTYANKITKDECRIDWSQPAEALVHFIRALSPAPGAFTLLNGEPFKIFAVEAQATLHHAAPGTVLDGALSVACGEGALKLISVQRAGKKRMPAAEMLTGNPVPPGTVMG